MRREDKVDYTKRIAYSWRAIIYKTRYSSQEYSDLVEMMKHIYPTIKVAFIHYVYKKMIKKDPLYWYWDDETNIMYSYETEHKKYGVYNVYYTWYSDKLYKELLGTYSSRRLAERVAYILHREYEENYIVEQL